MPLTEFGGLSDDFGTTEVFCFIITLGEECECNVCLWVCLSGLVTQKLLLRLAWFFYTRSIMSVVRSSSKMTRIRIWTQEFIWRFFTIGRYNNIRHDVKRSLLWKHALWHHMCIIANENLSSPIALLRSAPAFPSTIQLRLSQDFGATEILCFIIIFFIVIIIYFT